MLNFTSHYKGDWCWHRSSSTRQNSEPKLSQNLILAMSTFAWRTHKPRAGVARRQLIISKMFGIIFYYIMELINFKSLFSNKKKFTVKNGINFENPLFSISLFMDFSNFVGNFIFSACPRFFFFIYIDWYVMKKFS